MINLTLSFLLRILPYIYKVHSPSNFVFKKLKRIIIFLINKYKIKNKKEICFFPYNINQSLKWPLKQLGNLDSYCFFELQEMILHMYYYVNRHRYKFAIDFGTNVGIDAMVLASFGIKTYGYEPDKEFLGFANSVKKKNKIKNLKLFPYGILDKSKTQIFIRVLGNLTANHVKGARDFYGKHKEITCKFKSFNQMNIKEIPDLIKINIEGSESKIAPTIPIKIWKNADVFIEVHNKYNRDNLWRFFKKHKLNVFSQKKNWNKCDKLDDLPLSNKEGYIFVSSKKKMRWS